MEDSRWVERIIWLFLVVSVGIMCWKAAPNEKVIYKATPVQKEEVKKPKVGDTGYIDYGKYENQRATILAKDDREQVYIVKTDGGMTIQVNSYNWIAEEKKDE